MARFKRPKAQKSKAQRGSDPRLQALLLQAQALREQGQFLDAISMLHQAQERDNKSHPVQLLLAATYHQLGRVDEAIQATQASLALQPNDTQSMKILGAALIDKGDHDTAVRHLKKAWGLTKKDPQILRLLCVCLNAMGRHPETLSLLTAYTHTNNSPELLELACTAYQHEGREEDAITMMEQALTHHPDSALHLCLMANAQANAGDYTKEHHYASQAYELDPDNLKIATDYALALQHQGRYEEALSLYDRFITDHPDTTLHFLVNKANLYKSVHKLDLAVEAAQKALSIAPNNAEAQVALGQINQLMKNYPDSWAALEWNWHIPGRGKFRPTSDIPLWYGDDDLNDKTLLVFEDQGVGDSLLFMRFLPAVKARYPDCHIQIMAERKMDEIYQRSLSDICEVIFKQDSAGRILQADFMCALSSLPMALGTDIHTLPAPPLLSIRDALNYKQREDDLIIGLTWKTVNISVGARRSVELSDFAALATIPGVRLLNLQYGDTKTEREACDFDMIHDEAINPYEDMQGHLDQINACDLVISIDNTTVHAAGTLGKPVWVLLPYECYWRAFHHDDEATPWYPSMRLYRQDEGRLFEPVIKRIAQDLHDVADGKKERLEPPAPAPLPQPPAPNQKPRALLMNDTSDWYHWGCNATSTAIKDALRGKGYDVTSAPFLETGQTTMRPPNLSDFDSRIYFSDYMFTQPTLFEKIRRCDHLVINGEGTIHSLPPNARRLMYLAYIAKTFFGKTVHIINHACFPQSSAELSDPEIIAYYLKTYRTVDDIAVRDPISHDLLSKLDIPARLAFDSLPIKAKEWLDTQKAGGPRSKTIILAGSSKFSTESLPALKRMGALIEEAGYEMAVLSGAALHHSNDDAAFLATLEQAFGRPPQVIDAGSLDEWFGVLHQSPLLISGRFHYTIAAAALGTPFIAFEGNTPKLHALSEFLDAPPPLSYSSPDLTVEITIRLTKMMESLPETTAQGGEKLVDMLALAAENYKGL